MLKSHSRVAERKEKRTLFLAIAPEIGVWSSTSLCRVVAPPLLPGQKCLGTAREVHPPNSPPNI